MDIRQLREWGKRLFDSVGANTKKAIAGVISAAMIMTVALVAIPAQAAGNMVADPTTFTQWEQGIGNPTDPRSTGRVWTDKSVSTQAVTLKTYDDKEVTVSPEEDSFLVGLSAMSSAQKLIGVSNVTKPLDIVLVLDTSGSMAWDMNGNEDYVYTPVYQGSLDQSKTYYIPGGVGYRDVTWNTSRQEWGYTTGLIITQWHAVTPKTSETDTDTDHTQFYSRRAITTEETRMYALKQAVNGFIDQTIAANGKVSDDNKKNHIGLVTYAGDADQVSGLTGELDGLKDKVDDLYAYGGTYADEGLQEANTVLQSARADAGKIVIFFTDGEPGGNGFSNTVAKDAIGQAKTMKDNGASVYSVGIFTGADPSADVSKVTENTNTTLKSNAFMQGVSSNYPDATGFTTADLGTRAAKGNYYLAASDADALNTVFDTIWGEVSSNPTSPIQSETTTGTTEGQGNGVVTFTDQLGDYMRVTKMNSIVFAGTKYETVSSTTSADGSQTVYTFEGAVTANEIYQAADLSTMQIVVKHNTGKTGDLVTVNVPAELLPLRLYTANVDRDGNVTTSINRTNPMRLFYEVALKDGVEAKVANQGTDAEMRQYLEDHTVDGNVQFLTNAYDETANGANGSTTAVFTPATTNDFYYFTQDTPLYNSENLNDPAKSIEKGRTYYYQRTFYANNAKHEQWIDVLGENAIGKAVADDKGNYYAPAGTTRTGLSRLYTAAKTTNTTETATNAIAPHWVTNQVTVNLGNNGLLKLPIPGTLVVTEHVEWPAGATKNPDKAFPFTLELSGSGADGEYQATIAGKNVTVKNGSTFELKDGETATVYGLSAGARAKVTQTGDHGGPGWSVDHETDAGDIAGDQTTELGFVNTYALKPTTLAAGSITGSKKLVNRDWQPDESFTFQLAAGDANPNAPMPDPATVTVTNPGGTNAYKNGQTIPFEFGAIGYTAPGTYQYVVTETAGNKPGMRYSGARYIATVTVTDNRDGTMSASAALTNTFGDNGVHIDGEPAADSAAFTNEFLGENDAVATIRGIKHYTDHTGTNPNNEVGKFNVTIEADEHNPANGPTFKNDVPVGVDGTWARELQFTNDALNGQTSQTFTYYVREVVPQGLDANNPTQNGMTYDINTYNVQVVVSRDAQQNLIATVTYPNGTNRVELTNSYRAANTTGTRLQVGKKVTGHSATKDQFTFNARLTTGDAANVKIKQNDGMLAEWMNDRMATSPALNKDQIGTVDFGNIVFTMPGTYTFQMNEQLPNGVSAKDGWTYDTHTHTVTYTVTDNNGQLEAKRNTDGNDLFTNDYTASVNYGANGELRIGKTLVGRAMNPEEFTFEITPVDDAPMPNGAKSLTTKNPFSSLDGRELVWPVPGTLMSDLVFTQDDAGRTYKYMIREVVPDGVTEDALTKNGVTYDFVEHTVAITVNDNGKGTMWTETTVDGNKADTVARFSNEYAASAGKYSFNLAKTVTGRNWKDNESFTFDLSANGQQSNVPADVLAKTMPQQRSVTVTKPANGNTAEIHFGEFTFAQAGTYVYNVTEQQSGTTDNGLTYDGRTAIVSFTVVDNGLGQYTAGMPLVTGIGEANTFTNTYQAQPFDGVPTGMEFSKQLTGVEWTADRTFEFMLTGDGDAPMPDGAKDGVLTKTVGKPDSDDTVKFDFGAIKYTKPGTYKYTVTETKGDMPGVSYDDNKSTVEVTVTDDTNGKLTATATVTDGAFENTYTAADFNGLPTDMVFSKQLTGIEWPADREFEFTLEAKTADAPMPAQTTVSVGKPADGDTATFNFGAIKYTQPGTYQYTVKETKGDMPGVDYDDRVADVTVTVRDDGNGQLTAVAEVTDGAFVNAYGAQPSGGVPEGMTFIKQLTGIDWPADRKFEFTLAAQHDAPMPDGAKDGKLTVSVGKPADGTTQVFDFGAIKYTAEGTYRYTVSEVAGDMPGVAYATNKALVTVTVTDDKQGNLIAKASVDGNVFTNAYTAQATSIGSADLKLSKQLTGIAWPDGREFEFTLEAVTKDAPMPANATATVGKPVNGDTASFGFGEISYDKAGVYEYAVKETKGDMPGVAYDTHTAKITVEVTDNHVGKLEAKVTTTEGKFTNQYTAQPVSVGSADLKLSKQLTGIAWPKDRTFGFTIEAAKGTPMPKSTTATVGKPADGDTAPIDFGTITYDKAGVYEYAIKETKGDMPGVAYDTHTANVTVEVTDNHAGQLEVKVTTVEGKFTNQYTAQPFEGVPTGMEAAFSKQLTGIAWPKDRTFGFTLEAVTADAPMPKNATVSVGKPADGDTATFDFGAIRYEQPGVYEYTVKETKGDMPGVTYDDRVATVKVTVRDNQLGQLEAKAEVVDGAFTNTYKANQVTVGSADMKLSKQLAGIEWPQDRTFEFTLEAVTKDAPMPKSTTATVAKPANGSDTANFGFGDITYTKTGTYEYVVKETKGDMPGVDYAGHAAKVTVTVTDDKAGQLKADVKTTDGTFVNTYTAEEANGVPTGMTFSKQLTGIAWPADRQFTFTLTGANGAPMPEGTKDGVFTKSVGKPAAGDTVNFDFGAITYTKEGTYTYTVKELNGVMPGVAFDDHTATVTVKVEDDKQGHLVATATVDKAAFVNKYTANEFNGVPENMEFSKQLIGTAWADREFTFTLTGVDGAPMPAETTVTVGKPEQGDTAGFKFGAIKYTKVGTYKYVVTEHNDGMGGIAYDDNTANVTVEVKDNGRGQLIAEATVENGKFTNTYSSAAFDGVPTGMLFSKQLTGIDWPTDRAFEFTLEGVDGAPMPDEAKVSVGKPADGDTASFNFGNIRYEQPGTYAYMVKETGGDMPGVTNDTHVATVTVEIKDNGKGQLEATATVTGGAFVNTYGAQPSDGVPEGMTFIKQLNGTTWPADRQFEFTLTGEGNAPMPQGAKDGKLNVTVGKPAGNGGTQTFDFGKIVYDAEGVYKYTVTEVKGDMPGVTYDGRTATVTVTVKDDKAGKLVAKAEVTGGVFTNTYTANAFEGVPTNMEFSKQLTGVAWPEGRDFEFTLEGVDGAPMPADAKAKATKPANGDTAAFTFGAIRYDKVGTYEYVVRETKGDMPGVTYDGHAAKVTVTVSDNGKGQLEAEAEVAEGAFVNRYAAAPFEGVPTGMKLTKQLTGIAWPADRTFEFAIAAAEGTPMPAQTKISVGKPADGDTASFDFGSIRYDKAGTYEYTVKETRGTMPGVAYDGHTAKITVTVTDNGTGNLQAEAKVSESQFVNKYSAQPATGVPTDFTLHKRVDGMAWNENQQFEFTIQGQDGAPMPKNGTVTVGKPAEGDSASFDFGEIVYTRSGVYRYTVTEIAGNQPGMAYDGHTATITVDVADDGQGHLVTATTVENGLFTNKYTTQTVAYPGVTVTEDLTGRAQAQGEFQFVVRGSDEDMQRAGYKPQARAVSGAVEFDAAASGETVTVPGVFTGLELTHDDVRSGRKFNYEVDQIGAQSGNGLTVDEQVYAVQIWATDNGDGTMRVHTSVNGTETSEKTPVLPFHNVYATAPVTIGGDAQVRINAHKTLHGRDLVNGEFHFAVRDAKDAQLAAGTNAADGTVRFDSIEFTDARLADDVKAGIATAHVDGTRTVYRYAATVAEITDSLPSGVTALESGFAVTLVITDNGDGQLQANVEYPADANGTLNFVNQYGAASEVSLGMNGNKVLAMASGDNAPDITGKYTFTLSGSEGAPMPEKTQVTNDASGAVDFGEIKFTVANVFGESAADKPEEKPADENTDETAGETAGESAEESAESEESTETEGAKDAEDTETDAEADAETKDEPTKREKTLTYTVSESGTVAGVTNDAAAQRTIDVHVVDNGDGTLTVSRQSDAAGTAFTFTNTYGVQPVGPVSPTDPDVAGSVPLTKTLSGRDLRAGEFTFELVEASGEGRVVGTAANAADGTVSLPGVTFDKPGNYAYLVREVAGNAGGVSYDNRTYAAVAQVADAGDGTLAVTWQITDATGAAVQSMAFANEYAAEPTSVQFSVGKMLDGRDLVANEFSFALRGADGDTPMPAGSVNGMQTMANDAEGNVQFGAIGYTKPGDYRYTVSEVKGDAEGVTYDETEYAVTVHVTDDGEGSLQADLQYADGAEGIVFRNTYVKPQEPEQPDNPDKPTPEEPTKPTPTPSQPSTPATPSAPSTPTTPSAPSRPNAPSYSSGSHSTYTTYVGSMASTGSSIAIIVAVSAALVIAGAGLLLARKRGRQE